MEANGDGKLPIIDVPIKKKTDRSEGGPVSKKKQMETSSIPIPISIQNHVPESAEIREVWWRAFESRMNRLLSNPTTWKAERPKPSVTWKSRHNSSLERMADIKRIDAERRESLKDMPIMVNGKCSARNVAEDHNKPSHLANTQLFWRKKNKGQPLGSVKSRHHTDKTNLTCTGKNVCFSPLIGRRTNCPICSSGHLRHSDLLRHYDILRHSEFQRNYSFPASSRKIRRRTCLLCHCAIGEQSPIKLSRLKSVKEEEIAPRRSSQNGCEGDGLCGAKDQQSPRYNRKGFAEILEALESAIPRRVPSSTAPVPTATPSMTAEEDTAFSDQLLRLRNTLPSFSVDGTLNVIRNLTMDKEAKR